jgi:hypothetical protein
MSSRNKTLAVSFIKKILNNREKRERDKERNIEKKKRGGHVLVASRSPLALSLVVRILVRV